VLCQIIHRILSHTDQENILPPLRADKDPRLTVNECDHWLRSVCLLLSPPLSETIGRFLIADISPKNLVFTLQEVLPLTHWEDLLLRCAVIARKGWLQ
jgi:hypothetical protein